MPVRWLTIRGDVSVDQTITEADQRENARREKVRMDLLDLDGAERLEAEAKEAMKQEEYRQYRVLVVKAMRSIKNQ